MSGMFFPGSLAIGDRLADAMVLEAPDGMAVQPNWPPGFDGHLASGDDVAFAKDSDEAQGFLWAERDGVSVQLAMHLDGSVDGFDVVVNCPNGKPLMSYGFCWKLRFPDATSRPGDSGGGVYLRAASDPTSVRLLGFHFLRAGATSYAIDAENFLRSVVGVPGQDFTFH